MLTIWRGLRDMSTPKTIRGYVAALPVCADETKARVAVEVETDGIAYHVIPRGAGVDLDDHLSAQVQVTGFVQQDDENWLINVRAYELLEDDIWHEGR